MNIKQIKFIREQIEYLTKRDYINFMVRRLYGSLPSWDRPTLDRLFNADANRYFNIERLERITKRLSHLEIKHADVYDLLKKGIKMFNKIYLSNTIKYNLTIEDSDSNVKRIVNSRFRIIDKRLLSGGIVLLADGSAVKDCLEGTSLFYDKDSTQSVFEADKGYDGWLYGVFRKID